MASLVSTSTRSAVPKLASLAVLVGLLVPTFGGCSGANANPLIGSWKFASTTKSRSSDCSTTFVFADKMATIISPPSSVLPQGSVSRMVVAYITASPTMVAVTTDAGTVVNYNLTDKNHMYVEDPWGRCYYDRTS